MTREHDVEAAIHAGADALGFVFVPGSKRLLEPSRGASLVRMVPAFVARVGLFLDAGCKRRGAGAQRGSA